MTNITQGKTNIITDSVKLNARNAAQLATFYQETIGLTLIKEITDSYYWLGTPDQKVLLEIEQTIITANAETTGLYHHALLLPTLADLGTVLRHLIVNQYPLIGASNHGYSNAIYLDDPEGNGIEIYWDKDVSEWDILEDGSIAGITEPMDTEAALSLARTTFDGMPNGTTMGHVHLHVDDLEKSKDFYTNVLGLGLKYEYGPAALFLASGDYHHHLGVNIWKQGMLTHPEEGVPGLDFPRWVGSQEDVDYVKEQLEKRELDYVEADGTLSVTDAAGLKHVIVVK